MLLHPDLVEGIFDPYDRSCYYLSSPKPIEMTFFMVVDDVIVRIDVESYSFLSDKGVQVGATKAELKAVYKTLTASPHPYSNIGEYLHVKLSNGNG
jgi:hypothetical protein